MFVCFYELREALSTILQHSVAAVLSGAKNAPAGTSPRARGVSSSTLSATPREFARLPPLLVFICVSSTFRLLPLPVFLFFHYCSRGMPHGLVRSCAFPWDRCHAMNPDPIGTASVANCMYPEAIRIVHTWYGRDFTVFLIAHRSVQTRWRPQGLKGRGGGG